MTFFELAGQIVFLLILLAFSLIMSRYDIRNLAVPNWPYWTGCILLIAAGLIFHRYEIYLYLIFYTINGTLKPIFYHYYLSLFVTGI